MWKVDYLAEMDKEMVVQMVVRLVEKMAGMSAEMMVAWKVDCLVV